MPCIESSNLEALRKNDAVEELVAAVVVIC
jgi:hypothetical protein